MCSSQPKFWYFPDVFVLRLSESTSLLRVENFRRVHSEKATAITAIAYHVFLAQQEWGEDAVDFHMEQVKEKTDEEKAKEFEEYFGGLASIPGNLKVCGNRLDAYADAKSIWTNLTDFDCLPRAYSDAISPCGMIPDSASKVLTCQS